ncbi:STAS domain-containing protein [Alteriqipengyuania lutimaris]|uniref:STAS domain-containing protein n=1 Tax=Alteriqipengyuania lutimaris TaxID=1538146 RepID=A0A395LNF3_9SPHN|nr:STAS domain-containing protein [Alteriqipengyuania lutimaris]MBB3032505.1 anti-anti-sigma regulatory factor [Alteriqipengyuania lutimaris]RDS78361.1 STAS domain-containing protein [Alteriqipengyuania lutimaris]
MNSTPNPPDQQGEAKPLLKLPANGTTASAEDLRVQLVMILDRPEPAQIDASEVENAGQAVLQLLVAAQAEARAAGRPLTFASPSAAFCDRVERCRLTDQIGLDPEGVVA